MPGSRRWGVARRPRAREARFEICRATKGTTRAWCTVRHGLPGTVRGFARAKVLLPEPVERFERAEVLLPRTGREVRASRSFATRNRSRVRASESFAARNRSRVRASRSFASPNRSSARAGNGLLPGLNSVVGPDSEADAEPPTRSWPSRASEWRRRRVAVGHEPAKRALRSVQPVNVAVGFNRRRHLRNKYAVGIIRRAEDQRRAA